MRQLLLLMVLVVSVLLGDARPGWCPFSEPSPGAGIRLPDTVSPPASGIAAPPPPALYPVFDRPRDVDPSPPHVSDNGGPPMVTAGGAPNAWGQPAPPPPPSSRWMGNPLWVTSACLLLLLFGLLPLLWMRRANAEPGLPAELGPPRWRGWTQRTSRPTVDPASDADTTHPPEKTN